MNPRIVRGLFAFAAGLLVWTPAAISFHECTCPTAKLSNGWCTHCKVGYVAGIGIPSKLLYDTLDAHGHVIKPVLITCATCREALRTDGFCDSCRMGFVKGQAYLSRLTYHLARGQVSDPSKNSCASCAKRTGKSGWCDDCKSGIVGNVAFSDRAEFQKAEVEFARLLAAIEMIEKCEKCSAALFSDGLCTRCKIAYRNGKPVTKSEP